MLGLVLVVAVSVVVWDEEPPVDPEWRDHTATAVLWNETEEVTNMTATWTRTLGKKFTTTTITIVQRFPGGTTSPTPSTTLPMEQPITHPPTLLPQTAPPRVQLHYVFTISIGQVEFYDPLDVCEALHLVLRGFVPVLEGITVKASCKVEYQPGVFPADRSSCNKIQAPCGGLGPDRPHPEGPHIESKGPCDATSATASNPCVTIVEYVVVVDQDGWEEDIGLAALFAGTPGSPFRELFPVPSQVPPPGAEPPEDTLVHSTSSSPVILWLGVAGIGGGLVLGSLLIIRLTRKGQMGQSVQACHGMDDETIKPSVRRQKLEWCGVPMGDGVPAPDNVSNEAASTQPRHIMSPIPILSVPTKQISTRYASVTSSLESLGNPLHPPDSAHAAMERYSISLLAEALRDVNIDVSGLSQATLLRRARRLIRARSRPLKFCAHCAKPRKPNSILCPCRKVTYCDENCQLRHWCHHTMECEA